MASRERPRPPGWATVAATAQRSVRDARWRAISSKYAVARTDAAVAAAALARPPKRGRDRLHLLVPFRLHPRWPSESAHRRNARRYRGDTVSHHGSCTIKVAARLAALKGRLLELEHDESMVED